MADNNENTLDELMSRDPLALTKDPEARARVIAAVRAHQALVAKRIAEGKAIPRRKRARLVADRLVADPAGPLLAGEAEETPSRGAGEASDEAHDS